VIIIRDYWPFCGGYEFIYEIFGMKHLSCQCNFVNINRQLILFWRIIHRAAKKRRPLSRIIIKSKLMKDLASLTVLMRFNGDS